MLNNDITSPALIAFVFSVLSLIFGSLTLMSRCCLQKCQCEYHYKEDRILLNVALKSNQMRWNHKYCHRKFAKTVAHFPRFLKGELKQYPLCRFIMEYLAMLKY